MKVSYLKSIKILVLSSAFITDASPIRYKGIASLVPRLLAPAKSMRLSYFSGISERKTMLRDELDRRNFAYGDYLYVPGLPIPTQKVDKDDLADIYGDAIKRLKPTLKKQQIYTLTGNLDIVRSLLSDKSIDQNIWLEPAVAYAISHDQEQVVKFLLESSLFKPEALDISIILEIASELGQTKYVDFIISKIDPSLNDNMALEKESENGHIDVGERLIDDPQVSPTDSANEASRSIGHSNVVSVSLKELPPKIEAKDKDSGTGYRVDIVKHPQINPKFNEKNPFEMLDSGGIYDMADFLNDPHF